MGKKDDEDVYCCGDWFRQGYRARGTFAIEVSVPPGELSGVWLHYLGYNVFPQRDDWLWNRMFVNYRAPPAAPHV